MKAINKKKVTLCAFLAAASCVAVGLTQVNGVERVAAEEVTLSASEFYMENGASVRVKQGSSGIRFGFTIAKTGWEKLQAQYPSDTYSYKVYTEIDKTGNTDANEEEVIVQDAITFGENESEKPFFASIIYDELTAAEEDLAFALSLTANTYIDIVKTSDNSVVKTFEADNNGQSRSIREVAWLAIHQGLTGEIIENYCGAVTDPAAEQTFDAWGQSFSAKVNGDVYGVYLNDYNTKIDNYTVSNGTLSFAWENVEKNYNDQAVYVMTDTGIATYPCTPIFNMTQATAYKLRELSMDQVGNRSGLKVYVTENIDMSDVAWTVSFSQNTQKNYNLVIDGQGKTISGLKTESYTNNSAVGTGLFHTFTGSIKNLAFVNCAPKHAASGLIAGVLRDSTLENLYIELDSFKAGDYSGAISWQSEGGQTVTMKNVCVSMPTHTAAAAFVTGFGNATYNMTDCVFIGGNGKAVNIRDGYNHTLNGTPNYYEDIVGAYDTFYGKTDFVSTSFMSNEGSTIIPIANNAEDITKLLTATDGYLMLMEDIDLTGRTDGLVANFYGTLNGNGHTIKNIPVRNGSGYYGGIFGYLNGGTVKNVALLIPNMVANFGGIAYGIHNNAVIDNVYIKVNGYTNSSGTGTMTSNYQAAIGRNVYLDQVTITNTVVDMATENVNNGAAFIVGMYQRGTLDLAGKNCHFIGGNGYMMSNTGNNVTNNRFGYVKNYTTYTDRTDFDTKYNAPDSTITLSDEMKAWMGL